MSEFRRFDTKSSGAMGGVGGPGSCAEFLFSVEFCSGCRESGYVVTLCNVQFCVWWHGDKIWWNMVIWCKDLLYLNFGEIWWNMAINRPLTSQLISWDILPAQSNWFYCFVFSYLVLIHANKRELWVLSESRTDLGFLVGLVGERTFTLRSS